MNTNTWSKGLGWFSIALGVAEIAAAVSIARGLGIKRAGIVRLFGAREIAAGFARVARDRPDTWAWARIISNSLDIAALGATLLYDNEDEKKAALSMATASPIAALDILSGSHLGLAS